MADNWKDHAACKGLDISVFFPGTGLRTSAVEKYCSVCPVIGPCLREALQGNRVSGIWGGTTQGQRLRIMRNNNVHLY